jgi:hypothetical protein
MLKPETRFWIKTGLNVFLKAPYQFNFVVRLIIGILFLFSYTAVAWVPLLFYIFVPGLHILFSFILGIVVAILLFIFLAVRAVAYFYLNGYH